MDQHWPFRSIADILEDLDQRLDIVAVDRADVIKSELLEQGAAGPEAAGIFLDPPSPAVDRPRHLACEPLRQAPRGQIFVGRHQPRQRVAERSDRRRDRHVVVVEDDDQPVAGGSRVVHRFIGHARGQRPVADHRDRTPGLVRQFIGDREA
jgi:hypothetical protein